MAKGNKIVITANPRGYRRSIIIDGTPYPGTVMQVKAATEPVGGKHTWEVFDATADGDQRVIAVLDMDLKQGRTATTIYADEECAEVYFPLPGDYLNMLVTASGTGTGDSLAIGDLLMVEDGTGMLIATSGSPESEPFVVMETVSDVTATGTLVWVMFTGY